MPDAPRPLPPQGGIFYGYSKFVRRLAIALLYVSGTAIFAMMLLVCADVILRYFGKPITGSIDIVRMLGVVTLACALPYTTAVKGHVAIEYFFNKLNRRGRIAVDSISRIVVIALFLVLGWESIQRGIAMKQSGQVSVTLQWPEHWLLFVIAGSCFLVAMVVFDHLVHPRREMIKP